MTMTDWKHRLANAVLEYIETHDDLSTMPCHQHEWCKWLNEQGRGDEADALARERWMSVHIADEVLWLDGPTGKERLTDVGGICDTSPAD